MKAVNKQFLIVLALVVSCWAGTFAQTPGTSQFPTSLDTNTTLMVAANGCSTVLNGAINNSVTSITVNSQSCFPSTGAFAIESEYFIYTASTSTTFTVTRGAFGSAAASHATATPVRLSIIAAYHNVLKDAVIAVQAKLGTGSDTAANNEVLRGTGTGTSDWGQVSNAHIASGAAIALSKLSITGTPDGTKFLRDDGSWQAVSGGISALTGDVTASGSGSVAATLADTAVTPGSYTSADITVDSKGRVTSASNGSGGGGGANTALSNLASVAINGDLTTGQAVPARLIATIPTAASTSTAGAAAALTASDAIAGTVTAGAAAGGSVTITAGDAKRLTSGNANGGNITLKAGAKIGSGNDGQVLIDKAGTAALPGLAIGATDQGVSVVSGSMIFSIGGTGLFSTYTNGLRVASGGRYEFSSDSSSTGTPDLLLFRNAASLLRVGGNAAGNTPGKLIIGRSDDTALASGALSAFTETSSTNTVTDSIRFGTNSTGTPAAGFGGRLSLTAHTTTTKDQAAATIDWPWQTATHASRGAVLSVRTTSNAVTSERLLIAPRKTLTDATTIDLFDATLASGSAVGGVVEAVIYASDGTDFQSRSVVLTYQAVNKAGTITSSVTVVSETAAVSSGTLTGTWSANNGSGKITIQLNADSSLTPTSFYVIYRVKPNSEQTVSVL